MAVQRRARNASGDVGSSAGLSAVVQHGLRTPGQPLDHPTRDFMESSFGRDLDHVRIHTSKDASESARAINAAAYTVGRDVVFASRQYAPETPGGQHLLAHELTHIVQQGGGDWLQSHDALLRIDNSGESRADEVGHSVAVGHSAGYIPSSSRRGGSSAVVSTRPA